MQIASTREKNTKPKDTGQGSRLDCPQLGQSIATDQEYDGTKSMKVGEIVLEHFKQEIGNSGTLN